MSVTVSYSSNNFQYALFYFFGSIFFLKGPNQKKIECGWK